MDLAESGKLLFEPLWEEGLRRMDQKTWDRFCRPPEEPFQGAVSMPVSFYIMVLSNLNNRLILDLYWETIRYIRFPYLDNKADAETEVWNAGELSQEEVISALRNRFEVSYGKAASDLFAFMDKAAAVLRRGQRKRAGHGRAELRGECLLCGVSGERKG